MSAILNLFNAAEAFTEKCPLIVSEYRYFEDLMNKCKNQQEHWLKMNPSDIVDIDTQHKQYEIIDEPFGPRFKVKVRRVRRNPPHSSVAHKDITKLQLQSYFHVANYDSDGEPIFTSLRLALRPPNLRLSYSGSHAAVSAIVTGTISRLPPHELED